MKRILFMCSNFFGYYKHIINELRSQGYLVDYYNDWPSEISIIKGISKLKSGLIHPIMEKYFKSILRKISNEKYDIVFIMNGKLLTKEMIKCLRDAQKSARFIFYTWDSMSLYPNESELISEFDKAYSFDTDDCKKYNNLNLLPLFYTKYYQDIGVESLKDQTTGIDYDLVSICTAHPNRYRILHKIIHELESNGVRVFSYMYINWLQFLYNKLFIPEFKNAGMNEFYFKPLNEEKNILILKKTNAVLDIQHNKQSGLTIRTIETLGARKKLITTNKNIKYYDFYNENNVLILDEIKISDIKNFIKRDYKPLVEDIYARYSLRNWIDTIINEKTPKYIRKTSTRQDGTITKRA